MKRGSTFFLRVIVLLIGIAALIICIFVLPTAARVMSEIATERVPELIYLRYPSLIGLGATIIPFFLALYQTLKLLSYIDKSKAFSELSVTALKNIKNCAIIICCLIVSGAMPVVYLIADADDAPGLIIIGLAVSLAPIVIATFAAVLQKLLREVIDIKSENDLTV